MIHPGHFVAIFGGAVSGAEAAHQLAKRKIHSVVFEQNALPYGKIEDGLPKWHVKLRDKEEQMINDHLDDPYVYYVPNVELGKDIGIKDVIDWGFSAVLLATGAWQDRPLPLQDVDRFLNKGLYYQNPFVGWFNHSHDSNYEGQRFEIKDNAVVVGGGLASIDVVKILMIETVHAALKEKGHHVDILTIEKEGVSKIIGGFGFSLNDLGLKGCSLYYRRRVIDMPLIPMPPDPSPEKLEKAKAVRQKVLKNAMDKYLFTCFDCHMPIDVITDGERLTGLVFQETSIENGKAVPIPGNRVEVHSPLIISSIGSIPKPIPGISTENGAIRVKNEETAQVEGFDNVFALGNAVTGRGNIKESRIHGRKISSHVAEDFLDWQHEHIHDLVENKMSEIDEKIEAMLRVLKDKNFLSVEKMNSLVEKIKAQQERVKYHNDFRKWISDHLPLRLENM